MAEITEATQDTTLLQKFTVGKNSWTCPQCSETNDFPKNCDTILQQKKLLVQQCQNCHNFHYWKISLDAMRDRVVDMILAESAKS